MALIPFLIEELARDAYNRDALTNLHDQDFGLGLLNDDLLRYRPRQSLAPALLTGYLRPHRHAHPEDSGVSTISNQKNEFKVNLDVQQFKPEEINVKLADNYLVVEGKHEEKQDKHGFISRQFTRRYKLPENVNLEALKSNLSSDGILSITAPKKIEENAAKEIEIPIEQTHKPAIKQSNVEPQSAANGDKIEAN